MKIVGQELGRVSYLVDLVEIQPERGMSAGALVAALQDRYAFAVLPKMPTQEAPQTVLRFEHGRMPEPMHGSINYFEIHAQGLVVQSHDTTTADTFFEDVFAAGRKDHGLRGPPPDAKKLYLSSMVAEFETDISRLMAKWGALSGVINDAFKLLYGLSEPNQVLRLSIKPDPERLPQRWSNLLSDFTLERRSFAPYGTNRFYSIGPFPTELHIKILKHIESLAR